MIELLFMFIGGFFVGFGVRGIIIYHHNRKLIEIIKTRKING